MKNVVALFSEVSDAEQAIKKLSDAGIDLENAAIHNKESIESSIDVRAMPSANPAVAAGPTPAQPSGGSATGAAGAMLTNATIESYLENIGVDGEELAFFAHGIQKAGHIVFANVPNDQTEKAGRLMTEAGGRAPQVE
ncbi:MAG: hypothetical protein ACOC2Y_02730 [Spirochaetota bacterium]